MFIHKILITLAVMIVSLFGFFCMLIAAVSKGQKIKPDLENPKLDKFLSICKVIGEILCYVLGFFLVFMIFYGLLWMI